MKPFWNGKRKRLRCVICHKACPADQSPERWPGLIHADTCADACYDQLADRYFHDRVARLQQNFFFSSPPTEEEWIAYRAWWPRDKRWRPSQTGVYVVQLLGHIDTIKIGYATTLYLRLPSLKGRYGPCRSLLVIPSQDPYRLEGQLHGMFDAYDRYFDTNFKYGLECFNCQTPEAKALVENLYQTYKDFQVHRPTW